MKAMLLALAFTVAITFSAQAQDGGKQELPQATKALAKDLQRSIEQRCGPGPCSVAVFPFGNSAGKYTKKQGSVPLVVQGELIQELKAVSKIQTLLVGSEGLKDLCLKNKVDITAIGPDAKKATVEFVNDVKLDAAVIGSCEPPSDEDGAAVISATVVFKDGTTASSSTHWSFADYSTLAGVSHLPNDPEDLPCGDLSGRFDVQILVGDKPRTLLTCNDPKSAFWKVRFLELGPDDKTFSVRIVNRGTPPCKWVSKLGEQKRLFAAALLLDGINSIWESNDGDDYAPICRPPSLCRKWVLTSPGILLMEDRSSPDGYRRETADGDDGKVSDNSTVLVKGFQKGRETAAQFLFGPTETSVASRIGVFDYLGMISVHFYAEHINDDQPIAQLPEGTMRGMRRNLGVNSGADIPQGTFQVHLQLKPQPVEVWRIFYYSSDDGLPDGVSADDLTPVTN